MGIDTNTVGLLVLISKLAVALLTQDAGRVNSFAMYGSSLLSLGQCSGIQYNIYTDLSVVLQHI